MTLAPSQLEPELAEAYRQCADKNVLAALNPKIFFGYFSVCADPTQGHGHDTTFPGLDWGQSAEALLWLGLSWLSRGGVAGDQPEVVADLFVGVALLERSVELDETLAYATGLAALGAYHARSPDAELAEGKKQFERALALTDRKALTVQLMYAQNFACQAHDGALYRALLEEVLAAGDVLPAQRLENVIARRKAARYLGTPRLKRCGF